MKQFITGPKPDEKIVNLKEVSNIGFEKFSDRQGHEAFKIIINFGYGVSLKSDYGKIIPDYQYFIFYDENEYQKYLDELESLISDQGWLAPKVGNVVKRLINPDKISFISTDYSKNRLIFNLAAQTSFYNNNMRKTSDFLFVNFTSAEEMDSEYEYVKDALSRTQL